MTRVAQLPESKDIAAALASTSEGIGKVHVELLQLRAQADLSRLESPADAMLADLSAKLDVVTKALELNSDNPTAAAFSDLTALLSQHMGQIHSSIELSRPDLTP